MGFWKKLGDIIIQRLTPTYPETFVGVIEEVTESTHEGETYTYLYYHILYVDNKDKRSTKNTGRDIGNTRSASAQRARLNVEMWLNGGPVPSRLNLDHNGNELTGFHTIGGTPKKEPTPKKKLESTDNIIRFPKND